LLNIGIKYTIQIEYHLNIENVNGVEQIIKEKMHVIAQINVFKKNKTKILN
jgi:hypothetical protein